MIKKVIFFILIILAIIFFIYIFYSEIQFYYFKLSGKEEEICSDAKYHFKYFLESPISTRSLSIRPNLENSLSKVCNFNVTERYSNIIMVESLSCNDELIKHGLDNPDTLSIDDIRTFHQLSFLNSLNSEWNYLYEILTNDCDIEIAVSTLIFDMSYIGNTATFRISQDSLISMCLSDNFTEIEKRECLISLLNAEKSTLNDYSKMVFDVNITACHGNLLWLNDPSQWAHKSPRLSSNRIVSICKKTNEFRKEIRDKAITSNLNYLEKNAITYTLLLQDNYFKYNLLGKNPSEKLYYQILLNNMDNIQFKNMFKEKFEKYNLI